MDLGLSEWKVLVTGASSGLGRAIAEGFIAEGATVMACGRNPEHPMPDGAHASMCADLTQPGGAAAVVGATVDRLGGLDAVIAAAGGAVPGSVEDASEEAWGRGLELNLLSVVRMVRLALPHLRQRGGRIVILSALSASEPRADHVISNVSKSGVAALAKSLSREVADDGILVNCVAPGRMRSAQMDRAFADEQARARFADAHIPLRRFGTPEEVVPVTLLLGSPRNTYITGQTVGVDGGMAWSL